MHLSRRLVVHYPACYNRTMTGFDHFETLVEQLVEGSFNKLFPPPLHFSDLVRRLVRAMEEERLLVDGQIVFPNRYWVFLNPTDHAALGDGEPTSLAELSRCMIRLAQEGRGRFGGQLAITLHPLGSVAVGDVGVRAAHSASEVGSGAATHQMVVTPAVAPDARRWRLWSGECVYRLGEPVIRLGRDLSNDIVLDSRSVSRRHAQLRWRNGRYHVSDVQSSHGVWVNGRLVPRGEEHALMEGDCISLGGFVLTVGQHDDQTTDGMS
jgi:hypothetical protein